MDQEQESAYFKDVDPKALEKAKGLVTDHFKVKTFTNLKEKIIASLTRENLFLPFGLDLLNYDIIWTHNMFKDAPAATDGINIYVNLDHPIYIKQATAGVTVHQSLMHDLLHEDCHILFEHRLRMGSRDPELWNIACDYMIELFLINVEEEFKSQNQGTNIINMNLKNWPADTLLMDEDFANMLEEEIYDHLKDNCKYTKKESFVNLSEIMTDTGQDPDSIPGSGDLKVKITEVEFTHKGKKHKTTNVEFPDIQKMKGDDEEAAEKEGDRIKLAAQMMQSTLTKGVGSAEFRKFLGKLFNVKVDAMKILRDSIASALQKSHELSWGKPRISWLANPTTMPYMPDFTDEEKYGVAVFTVDESGSMSDDDIKKAITVLVKLKEHYKGIYVIKHDDNVSWDMFYEDPEDVDIPELLKRRRCGGTSHADAYKRVMKFQKDHPDDMISIVVACTDMCSDLQTSQHILPSSIPRVYLVNERNYMEVDGLIGKIVKVQ